MIFCIKCTLKLSCMSHVKPARTKNIWSVCLSVHSSVNMFDYRIFFEQIVDLFCLSQAGDGTSGGGGDWMQNPTTPAEIRRIDMGTRV